jgi:SAM-dependent methyltransferase
MREHISQQRAIGRKAYTGKAANKCNGDHKCQLLLIQCLFSTTVCGGCINYMRARRHNSAAGVVDFDRDYYQRYYFDPRTAVVSRAEMRARAQLIAAAAAHLGLPVKRTLEAGCGTGLLQRPLQRLLPRAQHVALEASAYLCRRYGWQHGYLEKYRARTPFDLVICYDVLQYLDDSAATQALANLGRLCRGLLYFSALTRRDFKDNCDPQRTDANVHLRTAHWYRTRLRPRFREAGLGFWLRRDAPLTVWELEMR